ncbi:MAG: hypothetical protein QOF83_3502, partial [Solirubrobacteraceae bacterium]|nr:hypothetical protein [Solirubrobacteraceae bacterium]
MSELRAQMNEWRAAIVARLPDAPGWLQGRVSRVLAVLL